MKHIYFLLLLTLGGTASAQTIANPGFEGDIGAGSIPDFPSVTSCESWNDYIPQFQLYYCLNATAETANPGEGSKSVVLTNTIDTALAGFRQQDNDLIEGMITQTVALPEGINAANLVVSFIYQAYTTGEEAAIFVQVLDTNDADPVDDFVLFEGEMNFASTVSDWTPGSIVMTPTSTNGEANIMVITCTSSRGSQFGEEPQTEGTQLKLDAFKVGFAGLNEVTAMTVSAYPNPATDVLHIQSETPIASVKILNADGRIVLTTTSADVVTSDLAPGSYFYEVTGANGNVARNSFIKR